MAFAPVLTPYTDSSPCPRVEVFFESFAAGTESVTVYRSAGGVEFKVRGGVRAVTAGTLTRIDFECPFNMSVSYRAEMFDGAGISLGFTDPGVLGDVWEGLPPGSDLAPDVDLPPGEYVVGTGLISASSWLHNPLDPQGAVRVEFGPDTAPSISRPVPMSTSYPRGRRKGVALAEPRRGLQGLSFDIRTSDLETADRVQALIGSGESTTVPVICIRLGGNDGRMRVTQPLFLATPDIEEVDINVRWGGTEMKELFAGDEAEPPAPGIFIPLLTAADINAYFATAALVNASHLRAADVNRRYDLAGYASA